MAIEQQIWVKQIQKNFYPDSSFLKQTTDFSAFVNYNTINIAEAGIDPSVLINNTTYPVPIKERADKNNEIELDEFATENTVVRDAEKKQLSYDKVESVIYSHRNTLQAACATKAAHAIAPAENGQYTPILQTSGAVRNGVKALTVADILDLKAAFDDMETSLDGRILVLSPDHVRDLILADMDTFKDITNAIDGQPKRFAGFSIFPFTKMPVYDLSGKKKAYGAVPGEGDRKASFAFSKSEVMRADGDFTMFSRLGDPEQRGDIIGFAKRFVCLPIRSKAVAALLPAVSA